jgi:hypothetical protein
MLTEEVQSLRADHNFAPDTAIQAIAIALRKNIDEVRNFQVQLPTVKSFPNSGCNCPMRLSLSKGKNLVV